MSSSNPSETTDTPPRRRKRKDYSLLVLAADCGGSSDRAARQLFVHPNPVRQRLRRVAQLTGRTLTAPRDVAQLCLALEAARWRAD